MTRRGVFEKLILASAAAAAPGCAVKRVPAAAAVRPAPRMRFPPVYVSPDRVTRTTVGLRPFRPSGFVLRPEKMDDKLVVHNYGHGGGGMTLSWGTADLAVEMVLASGATRI